MPTILEGLNITSVDLVDNGANPEARIKLFKRDEEADEPMDDKEAETLFKRFLAWFKKADIEQKPAPVISMQPGAMVFASTEKNSQKEDVIVEMQIDKAKMTPEHLAAYEELEKQYGVEGSDPNQERGEPAGRALNPPAQEPLAQGAVHPEVQKALEEHRALVEKQAAQIEGLQKNIELNALIEIAKKYELLGKKPDELALKLYDMKKAGGTVYDDYVAVLDESLAVIGKSGMFKEIGSNRSGGSDSAEGRVRAEAAEIVKRGKLAGFLLV